MSALACAAGSLWSFHGRAKDEFADLGVDPGNPETYYPEVLWYFGHLARLQPKAAGERQRRADQKFEAYNASKNGAAPLGTTAGAYDLLKLGGSPPWLVPFGIFRVRNVAAGDIAYLGNVAAFAAVVLFPTLYLQDLLGFSPLKTGFAFLPLAAVIGVAALLGSRLASRVGYKWPMVAGSLVARRACCCWPE